MHSKFHLMRKMLPLPPERKRGRRTSWDVLDETRENSMVDEGGPVERPPTNASNKVPTQKPRESNHMKKARVPHQSPMSATASPSLSTGEESNVPRQQERRYDTNNEIEVAFRTEIIELMNQRLADSIDLLLQLKQAHWNVKGPNFIALHKLFDEIYGSVTEYVDTIAERIAQLGGVTKGTLRQCAANSKLPEYPLEISDGVKHIISVARALTSFNHEVLQSIIEADEFGDVGTVDLFTEISRGIDKWIWFVEAHTQAEH